MEQSKDGVLILDLEGNVLEANSSLARMLGYTPEEMLRLHVWDWDVRWTREEVLAQLRHFGKQSETFETRHRRKDGSVYEVEVSASVATWNGQTLLYCVHRDISGRKQSELESERLHKQLVQASRQAGMAEVATAVLHNVGNVLNSVNVSATCVSDKIRKSKTERVARLAALLESHGDNMVDFLTNDETGRQLPAYVRRLADRLAAEQVEVVKEMELIRERLDHIKDIISMQQNYARVLGVVEKIKAADLIEDALRLNAGALARHDVQIIREYDSHDPEITVDKHKVLQALVNLIRNAKYACDDSGRKDKRLTVRLTTLSACVRITVADNGVGIPPENLGLLFTHGFTTRKDGHGFGLHSAAIAASEMGGVISVHSPGHLQGATFTLDLPFEPPKPPKRS